MLVDMRYIHDHFAATNEAFNSATAAVRTATKAILESCEYDVDKIVQLMKDRPKVNPEFVLHDSAQEVLRMLLPLDMRHVLTQRFSSKLSSKPIIRRACAAAKC
jgi:hypothetical protein